MLGLALTRVDFIIVLLVGLRAFWALLALVPHRSLSAPLTFKRVSAAELQRADRAASPSFTIYTYITNGNKHP